MPRGAGAFDRSRSAGSVANGPRCPFVRPWPTRAGPAGRTRYHRTGSRRSRPTRPILQEPTVTHHLGHARHRARRAGVQRDARPARGPDRRPGLLLGPVRRGADAVRARAVHDDRRRRRRQDLPAAVLGRVGAARRGHGAATSSTSASSRSCGSRPRCGGCRVGPPDADDRPQGQVHARARRRPDPPVRVDRDRASRRSSR